MGTPEDEIVERLTEVETLLRANGILELLRPPAGPYALFHHISFALERLGDVKFIFSRMVEYRRELSGVFEEEFQLRPLGQPERTRSPEENKRLGALMGRQTYLTRALRLDFESLYAFGAIFLDQWSIAAAYLVGMDSPETMTFHQLARRLELQADLPAPLRHVAASIADVRWLHLQFRTFRNRFVEHADRPWQRGTTAGVRGMDFALFLPSPPGWLNDEEIGAEIKALLPLAPAWLLKAPEDHWMKVRPGALLERLVDHVGSMDAQADRERVANLVGKAGISTPTFQTLVLRIATFSKVATGALLASARENVGNIKLGPPWRTSNPSNDGPPADTP